MFRRLKQRLHSLSRPSTPLERGAGVLAALQFNPLFRHFPNPALVKELAACLVARPAKGLRPPGPGEIYVVAPHCPLLVQWRSGAGFATGRLWNGDLLGLWDFLHPDHPAPIAAVKLEEGGEVYVLRHDQLQGLLDKGGAPFRKLLQQLAIAALAVSNPAVNGLYAVDRWSLSAAAVLSTHAPGTVLHKAGQRPEGLYLAAPGSPLRVHQTGLSTPVELGLGALLGAGCLAPAAASQTETLTVLGGGMVVMVPAKRLDQRQMDGGTGAMQTLGQSLQGIGEAFALLPVVLDALARDPVLGALSLTDRVRLLLGYGLLRWRVGCPPPPPIRDVAGMAVILRGAVIGMVRRPNTSGAGASAFEAVLAPAEAWGPLGVVPIDPTGRSVPGGAVLRVAVPTVVFFIQSQQLTDLSTDRPLPVLDALRLESGGARVCPPAPLSAPVVEVDDLGQSATGAQLPFLLGAMVARLHNEFGEQSLLVLPGAPAGLSRLSGPDGAPLGGLLGLPAEGADVQGAIAGALEQVPDVAHVFWVPGPGGARALSPAAGLQRRVFVNTVYDKAAHPDSLVPWPRFAEKEGTVPFVYVTIFPQDLKERLVAEGSVYPPSTTRLPLGPDFVSVQGAVEERVRAGVRAGFGPERVELGALDRLARAATDRRVGVALAGGDAWGGAHFALLAALADQQIPVDIVSGASVGSLFGTYYCTAGLDGLYKHILSGRRRLRWQIVNSFASLQPSLFSGQVNKDLGAFRVETFSIPMFSVGTQLNVASASPVLRGDPGQGCLQSGSVVPIFPAAFREGEPWVDGAFSDNLPVDMLHLEGARLIVSSNVVAPPSFRDPDTHATTGSNLNPIRRMLDTLQAIQVAIFLYGSHAATTADVSFQTHTSLNSPFDILFIQDIVDAAVSQPSLWYAMRGVTWRWRLLGGHRRAAGGLPATLRPG